MKVRSTTSPAAPSLPTLLPSIMTSTPPALPIRSLAVFPWNWRTVPAGNVPSMLTFPSTVTLSQEGAERRTSRLAVPDASGLAGHDVVAALTKAGLVPQIEGWGRVVRQNPPPGTSAPKGSAVRVVLEPAS